jgi:hypothetical protein
MRLVYRFITTNDEHIVTQVEKAALLPPFSCIGDVLTNRLDLLA